jgi:hypothetical protein
MHLYGRSKRLRSKISTLYSTSVAKIKLIDNIKNIDGDKNQDVINKPKIK